MEFKGKQLEDYMKENFETNWSHYDVLKHGKIDITMAPMLLKKMIGNVDVSFGL